MTNNTQRSVEEKLRQENKTMTWQIGEWKKEEDMWLDREKSLMKENEVLKAQVSGLVEALDKVFKWEFDFRGDCVADAKTVAKKALSTLPSTFLEIQKAKEDIVLMFKNLLQIATALDEFKFKCYGEFMEGKQAEFLLENAPCSYGDLSEYRKALRTLQQAQEIK